MTLLRWTIILSPFLCLPATAQPTRGWLTVDTLMRDAAWMGTPPSSVRWTDDGQGVTFRWRTAGDVADSLYIVPASGGTPRRMTLDERKNAPSRSGDVTMDHSKKVYERDGDLFILTIRSGTITRLTNTVDEERNPSFARKGSAITFERSGDLYLRDLATGLETQLTNFHEHSADEDEPKTDLQKHLEQQQLELFDVLRERKTEREASEAARKALAEVRPRPYYLGKRSVSALQLSPDGRYVTFVLTRRASGVKSAIVPAYVTESGFTEDLRARSKVGEPQSTQEFAVFDIKGDTLIVVKAKDIPGVTDSSGGTKPTERPVWYSRPMWSDDGTHAFVQLYTQDNKDRWIVRFHPETASFGAVLDHQRDDAWIGGPGNARWGSDIGWMPDAKSIWFQSEQDGWSHLYTVDLDGGNRKQLTSGRFEVYDPTISRDKKRWYFSSNEEHYGERHFYSMPLAGGKRTRITSMEGGNVASLSPNEDRIAILYSNSNTPPELYLMDNRAGETATQVTASRSAEVRSYDWRAPQILTIKARDGADVPARLYTPAHPNGAAVVFVHGAGYLQNAHKWWSSYFREYMFHNLLADKGYTVLDIDYRGSAGLGRDWRTAIYRYMGGKDLDDQVDGASWLVKNHGIDPKRIGMYGGSYGGFITFMAMFTTPGVFAAGAALRPVSDWAHYNHGYTSNILNIPQEDTVAYRRSSPIYHVEGFQGALLICHGMMDVNVHFQDAVRVVQRLIELKKENWELAVYPVEDHGFVEPTSWTDEYRRILKLFEEHL